MGAGTWIAVLLLADAGAFGGGRAVATGSGTQIAIAVAALVGMGTKAGLVPLHTWLPRAHPIAPAHVSALMSGVMIKIAIYGLVRVLVDWLGELPAWYGVVVLRVGARRPCRRRLRDLPARAEAAARVPLDRERRDHRARRSAPASLLRTRGADAGPASRSRRRSCTPSTTRSSRRCSSSAPARSSGRSGSLELDRLGGLLRRMPWTGGAFLVGAMAIAGLPPLNGFASEWLTLQSLLAVPARRRRPTGSAGALALGGARCNGRARGASAS